MSIRRSPRLLAAALALTLAPSLHAAAPNRIPAMGNGSVSIPHNVSGRTRAAADLGQAPLDRKLSSVTLHFNRTDAQQAALTQLLADLQNPASARYHQWLTPEQFGAQFGLSAPDLTRITTWLTAQGLAVTDVARSSTFITVSGTVAQVQNAFNTEIHTVSLNGEQHIANVSDPVLPTGLATVVTSVTGLDDFKLKPRIHPSAVRPNFTSSISGSHFIAPGDFYTIYDTTPLLTSAINGTGITIAIMGMTDISLADVAAFRSAAGLVANAPTVVVYGTDPGTRSTDLPEAQLDVEWSGAVAPNAKILYVNSTDVIGTSLVQAIDKNLAPILSVSYGLCEAGWGQAALTSYNQGFEQANAQGQTIVGPGGDSGATDCDYSSSSAADGLAVDFPGSSPFVTGAGGTMFNEGTGSYWSTSNGGTQGSALAYIPELPWNETSTTNGLAAGGGGSSTFFSKPAWQVGTGVPNDFARDVPDISLAAASSHDGFLYCVSGSCVNGFRASDQTLSVVGGTSVSAPTFAGILAMLEQKTGRLGNANPTIYGLANSTYASTVFHDILSGNNNSPCLTGTPDCPTGGTIGYTAAVGYDRATGWGSLDAFNFVNTWSLVTPTGVGSGIGTTLTSTTVTAGTSSSTNAACAISSGSVPLTISVAGSGSTAAVTGTVEILIDNAVVGTATLNNGTATYTLTTSTLSSGGHTVAVSYLGNSTYAGSRSTLVTDVVSTTRADFSLTPCAPSISATSGTAAQSINISVTPFTGFTGPVTLSVSSDGTFSGAYTFGTSKLPLSGTTAQSTTLTLYAYTSNSQTATTLNKLAANHPPSNSSPSVHQPSPHRFYATGSGLTLAAMLLLTLPRRRRLTPILAILVSVGVLGASGCSGGGNTINNTSTTGSGTAIISKTPPATYTLYVTATASTTGGTLVHTTPVTFTVR